MPRGSVELFARDQRSGSWEMSSGGGGGGERGRCWWGER